MSVILVLAIDRIIRQGQLGRTYNVGGNSELANLTVVETLCFTHELQPKSTGSYYDQVSFVTDRPGHDRRYELMPLVCVMNSTGNHKKPLLLVSDRPSIGTLNEMIGSNSGAIWWLPSGTTGDSRILTLAITELLY